MFSLVMAILFGLMITFFAFQNQTGVPILVGNLYFQQIPVYLVVTVSILSGIIMAWFISAFEGLGHHMNIRQKNRLINSDKHEIVALRKRIANLEAENSKLMTDKRGLVIENKEEREYGNELSPKPSFWQRIFPSSHRYYSKQV